MISPLGTLLHEPLVPRLAVLRMCSLVRVETLNDFWGAFGHFGMGA